MINNKFNKDLQLGRNPLSQQPYTNTKITKDTGKVYDEWSWGKGGAEIKVL